MINPHKEYSIKSKLGSDRTPAKLIELLKRLMNDPGD